MTESNILAGFGFFSEVQPATLENIARMAEIMEFQADDVIFRYNEPAAHLYFDR